MKVSRESTPAARKPVITSPVSLAALRAVIRDELRRVGLRPEMPAALGAYTFDGAADAWQKVESSRNDATLPSPEHPPEPVPQGATGRDE